MFCYTDNPLFGVEYGDPDEEKDDVDPLDFTMWIEDPRLDSGSREYLSHGEELFWKQLIDVRRVSAFVCLYTYLCALICLSVLLVCMSVFARVKECVSLL